MYIYVYHGIITPWVDSYYIYINICIYKNIINI